VYIKNILYICLNIKNSYIYYECIVKKIKSMKVDILKNKKTGKLSYYYDNNIHPSEKTHKFIKAVDDTKVRKEMEKLDNEFKKY